ncbi:MAG TPA: hypothetical protein VIH48_03385 [Candidatus Bathyarchaeia archaeon]
MLFCSSILEEKTAALYLKVADKARPPLVKSFFLHIAYDSKKHSTIFKGLSESVAKPSTKPKECKKRLGQIWRITETLTQEIMSKQRMPEEKMTHLVERLATLEIAMAEEYYTLVQAKTLSFMIKEIKQIYNVNFGKVRHILNAVIRDEERHQMLLATIKKILAKERLKQEDNSPKVKYQSPDSWIRSLPSTS